MGEDGVRALAKALHTNTSLTMLDREGNPVNFTTMPSMPHYQSFLERASTTTLDVSEASIAAAISKHETTLGTAIDDSTRRVELTQQVIETHTTVDQANTTSKIDAISTDCDDFHEQIQALQAKLAQQTQDLDEVTAMHHQREVNRATQLSRAQGQHAALLAQAQSNTAALQQALVEAPAAAHAQVAAFGTRGVEALDRSDVLLLLQHLNMSSMVGLDTLEEHGVDGSVLAELTEADLEDSLGIAHVCDRRRLMLAVGRLKRRHCDRQRRVPCVPLDGGRGCLVGPEGGRAARPRRPDLQTRHSGRGAGGAEPQRFASMSWGGQLQLQAADGGLRGHYPPAQGGGGWPGSGRWGQCRWCWQAAADDTAAAG